MEAIAFFGAFIILIAFYMAFRLRWLFELLHKATSFMPFNMLIPIIEKAYHAVDFQQTMEYTDLMTLKDLGQDRQFDYFSTERIVDHPNRLNHFIEQQCVELTKEMIRNGVVEITDQEHPNLPPWRKRILMKVKVYKPD